MIEVFKTNVKDRVRAKAVIRSIRRSFNNYKCNFDLDDCDRILRIECAEERIELSLVIQFLRDRGIDAEVLGDEVEISVHASSIKEMLALPAKSQTNRLLSIR